jgi:hypothetical protein
MDYLRSFMGHPVDESVELPEFGALRRFFKIP